MSIKKTEETSTTRILDTVTDTDFWRAELVIIQVKVARYRRDGDSVRKIAEQQFPGMGLLASENTNESPWGPQIESCIAFIEDEAKVKDLELIKEK